MPEGECSQIFSLGFPRGGQPSFTCWSSPPPPPPPPPPRTSVSAPVESTPELLTLHAVRLKGMADDAEVAARFELDPTLARELLLDFQAFGWITRVEFVGTAGWTLTESGRSENERQLAHELAAADSNSSIRHAYVTFLPYNDRLLRACTDWQLRPTGADPLAVNEHTDKGGTSACSLRCRALATSSVRFARNSGSD